MTPLHRPGAEPNWRTVTPALAGIGLFIILALFNEYRDFTLWRNYALSGVLLGAAATYAFYVYDVRIPHYILWVIVGALLTHYVGGSLGSPDAYRMGLLGTHGINGAYHTYDWWDHLTHGVGIGASAMGIAYLVEMYQVRRGLGWGGSGVWLVSVLAALAAGVGVELYEYLGKTAFQTIDQGGYENTMRDLHFNLIGAIVGAGVAVTVNRTTFRRRIREQWRVDTDERTGPTGPWYRRITPGMSGFVVFCTIPALTALYLSTQFFSQPIPPELDVQRYDPALQTLTASAAAALVLGPLAGLLQRRILADRAEEAPP